MNQLKVLKKALRRLLHPSQAEAPASDAVDAATERPARDTGPVQGPGPGFGKGFGKGGGKGGGQGIGKAGRHQRKGRGAKGPGTAGALLAAAAMGSTGAADAGPAAGAVVMPAGPVGGVMQSSVVYKQTDRGALHLETFVPTGAAPASGRACVVFFHGGGWRRGTTNQFRAFAAALAQRGLIGMSVEYRLLETEERLIPLEAIEDARSAMRYVRGHAQRLGCDPERIAAGGGSAGAHLALMTAMKSTAPLDDAHDDLSIDPRPAALIVLNGPVNFDGYDAPIPVEQRRKYAPFYLMDRTLPPTLMMHGTQDRVVPYAQVAQFKEKAVQLGLNVKLVAFEGRGHGFFNRGKGQPGDWDKSLQEMVTFLHGLGWI